MFTYSTNLLPKFEENVRSCCRNCCSCGPNRGNIIDTAAAVVSPSNANKECDCECLEIEKTQKETCSFCTAPTDADTPKSNNDPNKIKRPSLRSNENNNYKSVHSITKNLLVKSKLIDKDKVPKTGVKNKAKDKNVASNLASHELKSKTTNANSNANICYPNTYERYGAYAYGSCAFTDSPKSNSCHSIKEQQECCYNMNSPTTSICNRYN